MTLMAVYLASPLLLVLLLISRKSGSRTGVWLCKPALSAAFVLCGMLNAQSWGNFELLMLAGFFCCFLGDVLLIPEKKMTFSAGLASFLCGHLFYIAAFAGLAIFANMLIVVVIFLLVGIVAVMRWLSPYLGEMRFPVVLYVLAISSMVFAACALAFNDQVPMVARALIVGGALGFFLSDLLVVRQRFVSRSFVNPLLGLPLYYGAQFALAISLAYIA